MYSLYLYESRHVRKKKKSEWNNSSVANIIIIDFTNYCIDSEHIVEYVEYVSKINSDIYSRGH